MTNHVCTGAVNRAHNELEQELITHIRHRITGLVMPPVQRYCLLALDMDLAECRDRSSVINLWLNMLDDVTP